MAIRKSPLSVYGECSQTRRENDALFHGYSGKHETQLRRKAAVVDISNTNRQQIINNNSDITFNSARRLSAHQPALETKLQSESSSHIYSSSNRA
ncbi:hypothetical protein AVEN_146829-1 [Araneus ventricosus]|uniref:Uncharacterized protein n=1 Tax=Araneus ventricosus TaxID=182803 RepID=A0A4Y2U2H7_ARAVE|nr:hypothetical protein AVEN_107578-1 [Araneus ventricosus]GBO06703.1 hypothetical protein AVEN_146829-1 [Araneus ventricosus]